jgi:mercuric reductase
MTWDLAIVGAGSAAFAAAIHARRRKRRVVMIERDEIGGTCVNVGCIPSKALLAAAEARHSAGSARFPGVRTSAGSLDWRAMLSGTREIVDDLRRRKYTDLAAEYGWEVLRGAARFVDGPALEVDGRRLEAAHYLIATGSKPWAPPIPGLDAVGYLTSTTAMELEALPPSLLIIGGNYIGLELGQLFSRLDVKVTIVEALDRIAPHEEPEISETLAEILRDEGVTIRTAARVTGVERHPGGVAVTVDTGDRNDQISAAQILVATGRRPDTEGLNLEVAGVRVGEKGEVVVDAQLRTSNPRVWAAGDVTGHPQFVYVAGAQGVAVVENALEGAGRTMDYRALPRVTFTSPTIAAVGMTEAEMERAGVACDCRVVPLELVPRALVSRDTRGLVKIVAERRGGAVRGVHMLAPNAGDAILAGVYAVAAGFTVDRIADLWCPYLTMAEGIKLAAQAFALDVSKLSCCA